MKAQSIADGDYSTSSLSINPNYENVNGERILTGQRAQQSLSVKIRDLSQDGIKIQDLLQELVQVRGVEINGVNFEQTDRKLGTRQARQEAYKSALKKAEAYQSLSGQPLRRVLRIKDISSGNYIPFFSSAEAFISRPSLIPPKDVRVSASVEVIFGLSP